MIEEGKHDDGNWSVEPAEGTPHELARLFQEYTARVPCDILQATTSWNEILGEGRKKKGHHEKMRLGWLVTPGGRKDGFFAFSIIEAFQVP